MRTNQNALGSQQRLADRLGELTRTVNQVIADIESDLASPGEAAFHAKDAYRALCSAHNALLDSARNAAANHYGQMARDAQQAAA
ncbi:hypothetical protein SAMN02800692_1548 [Luteibacter sp. UNC138MFCol5.1]|uniref:hypothetical protein n=1 Tax=Luteibacter sp. UNC138MFCol5.1 TaxID=1502774 RepID=UPI0008B09132|nr:hypothetical protein [Luteibacter sp. UNC138MFCol5.1]SEO64037.1 hypothetical protein SAMN02800692_1548 [Luteibacter sp. UNC138MFCol5.1]